MHALIVERDAWIVLMIEDALRELGYTSFAFATSAEEAVEAAAERCPDLITSDIRLGAGNGLDAVQTICSAKPIPVVFVTTTGWEARERNPRSIIVQKPFQPSDLKGAVMAAKASVSH